MRSLTCPFEVLPKAASEATARPGSAVEHPQPWRPQPQAQYHWYPENSCPISTIGFPFQHDQTLGFSGHFATTTANRFSLAAAAINCCTSSGRDHHCHPFPMTQKSRFLPLSPWYLRGTFIKVNFQPICHSPQPRHRPKVIGFLDET